MHSCNFDISLKDITKIEGNASLDIEIKNNKVKNVKLKVTENKRFYKEATLEKPFQLVPSMVSRICGTCSIAHNTCAIKAIEKALNIQPSHQTIIMRKLSMNALMIRDHAMHLYFFVLPDVFEKDSVLDFEDNDNLHELLHDAFDIKSVANELAKITVGKAIHGYNASIGEFNKIPKNEDINPLIDKLENIRQKTIKLIDILFNCNFNLEIDDDFVALKNQDFSFLEGKICSTSGYCIEEENFIKHLHTNVIPYSQSDINFNFENHTYILGALSRINLNKSTLNKRTQNDLIKYLSIFPSNNVFHNNLAQAIEILHCIDSSIDILKNHTFEIEPKIEIHKNYGEGIGVIEAPRGILYYHLNIKEGGTIIESNIVIPTAQNVASMEKNIKKIVELNIDKDKKFIQKEIEKLIRAYDPCMSCATNFLKIKWL